jgi:hypothetical protein
MRRKRRFATLLQTAGFEAATYRLRAAVRGICPGTCAGGGSGGLGRGARNAPSRSPHAFPTPPRGHHVGPDQPNGLPGRGTDAVEDASRSMRRPASISWMMARDHVVRARARPWRRRRSRASPGSARCPHPLLRLIRHPPLRWLPSRIGNVLEICCARAGPRGAWLPGHTGAAWDRLLRAGAGLHVEPGLRPRRALLRRGSRERATTLR